ncbi:MAG: hypothetical protein K5790_10250 [Nitrosopumilus sp.]|uniref:hypothetical protein n=1 Tax=Nitrosopumilus sp. TaxID=2024843 RepID=UPI00247C434C|nr:hypothetical protein [Nitrosopumilus sp.]MCV0393650.1 hypothetical protein [Nitrosopumilus sp.]
MKTHSHHYQIQIIEDKKVVERYVILVPYNGNETADKAVKAVMKSTNHYRNSRNQIMLERCDYTIEYIETKLSDDLQAIAIEKQGYAVIPMEGDN